MSTSTIEQRANLHGKVAAIVVGASGIGAAVTLALAREGSGNGDRGIY